MIRSSRVRASRRARAFTLIELLVVIAIIGILIGLLLPAVQKVREAANRSKCMNNLKQIALACHNYHDAIGHLPPGSVTAGGTYWENWAISILPFIEQDALFRNYNLGKSNFDAANQAVVDTFVKTYNCPSDPLTGQLITPESGGAAFPYATASYRAMTGLGDVTQNGGANLTDGNGFFDILAGPPDLYYPQRGAIHITGCKSKDGVVLSCETIPYIIDGTSNTVMFGEYTSPHYPRRTTFWGYTYTSYSMSSAIPSSLSLSTEYTTCANATGTAGFCKRAWGSMHPEGFNVALCDGSVRFIQYGISLPTWEALGTIAGGEVIPADY
jgi:prepilin-type N-terminal cleavage/methylation domain-containing protein/prepilin-type processing-associated H-X9-DG protein